jgi:LacI family transcriptional regulator
MMAGIKDVAREAGVSPATVSRYLNNRLDLPGSTKSRIDTAIKHLDYRPNLLARRLSTGRAEIIGVVAPEIANPFFTNLVAAIEDEAERHGYSVLLSSTRGMRSREMEQISRLEDRHVDGLILMTNQPDDGTLAAFIANHKNVVLLDEDVPGFSGPKVFVENTEGAYEATRLLIEAGHKRIAHVGGPPGLMSTTERQEGFFRAMEEAELQPSHVLLGSYSREFGASAMGEILAGPDLPSAVFAGSDFVAMGVMGRIFGHGLRVPEDISLVGFDDMPFTDMLAPPLTTIRQPVQDLGRKAFQALFAVLNDQPAPGTVRLPTLLIHRQSVAARP